MLRFGVRLSRRPIMQGRVLGAQGSTHRHMSSDYDGTQFNKRAKEKLESSDDERWLEAEIDRTINSPEERYAHSRQADLMKNLVKHLQAENAAKLEAAKAERTEEINSLKKQMEELESRLKDLQSQK